MTNTLDKFIEWFKTNTENISFNNVIKSQVLDNQIYNINFRNIVSYNTNNKTYTCIINNKDINNANENLIINSDDCKINKKILTTIKPDYILMSKFNIDINELKEIPLSIFYKSNKKETNSFIKEYLEKKFYSLIISMYKKNFNFYEYSMYSLLMIVYDDNNKFELLVKYILLNDKNLDKNEIIKLENYIKSKSVSEYYFMHKYILKTPEYVIKNIIDIKQLSQYKYKIRYNEKVYLIRYLNNIDNIDNIDNKKRKLNESNSLIKLLSKWYIYDIINEFEKNIKSYYNNCYNNKEKVDLVIYSNSFSDEIDLIKLVQTYIYSNNFDDSINYIFESELEKYDYDKWTNEYFNGNINNYIQG